jgi:hypothetical protein
MKKYNALFALLIIITAPLSLVAAPVTITADPYKDAVHHRISLYLWGAGMSGNGNIGNAADSATVDTNLDNLEAGLMANYRLKKGHWAFNFDYVYLNVTPTSDNPPADVDLKQSIAEISAGYEVSPGLELLAGVRYVDIDMKATIKITPPPPAITGTDDWIDPIVGLDYRAALSDKWRFFGRADVGGFGVGSDLTYQLAAYIGYMPSKSWNLYAGYRHLDFDYKSDNDKKFFYDMTLSGPLVGFGYHF